MSFAARSRRVQWVVFFLLCTIFLVISTGIKSPVAYALDTSESLLELNRGWEYRWGDSPKLADGTFEWATARSEEGWAFADTPDGVQFRPLVLDGQPEDLLWMRIRLPESNCTNCSIWFEDLTRFYEVYVDEVKIGGFGTILPGSSIPFSGESSNLWTLPANASGKWLTIRVQSDTRFIGLAKQIWYGQSEDVFHHLMNTGREALVIGIASICIGLLLMLTRLTRLKDPRVFWLGCYAVSMGVMFGLREKVVVLFFSEASWTTAVVLISYILTHFFFLRYFITHFGQGPHRVVHWMSLVSASMTLGMILTSALSIFSLYQWSDGIAPVLLIFSVLSIVWTIATMPIKMSADQWVTFVGLMLVIGSGIFDAISAIILNGQWPFICHWILLGFVTVQIIMLINTYRNQWEALNDQLHTSQQQANQNTIAQQESSTFIDQLKQSIAELTMKTQELTRLNQQKDHLLNNTAHDLRSPLNGIIGITDALLNETAGKLNATMRSNLQLMLNSAKRIHTLVSDITDYSKLKNHTFTLQHKRISLYEMVHAMITLFEPLVTNKPVFLVNQVDPSFPEIMADENRMNQILNNLLTNSIKHTLQGNITIRAEVDQQHAMIRIRDNGISVPTDQIQALFKPVEEPSSEDAMRSGFGLSIAKQLVEMHRGKLLVTSVENEYTEFAFSIPLAERIHSESKHERSASASVGEQMNERSVPRGTDHSTEDHEGHLGNRCSILIVDDEPINIQVLQNLLTPFDYRITTARDGFEALHLIQEQGPFDLILLDVMMPRLSGYDVCMRIRNTHNANEMPILLLTAKNTIDDLVRGFQVGANDYLTKPFAKQELIARVQMQLHLVKNHQSLQARNERPGR